MPSALLSFDVDSEAPTQVFVFAWQDISWLNYLPSGPITVSGEAYLKSFHGAHVCHELYTPGPHWLKKARNSANTLTKEWWFFFFLNLVCVHVCRGRYAPESEVTSGESISSLLLTFDLAYSTLSLATLRSQLSCPMSLQGFFCPLPSIPSQEMGSQTHTRAPGFLLVLLIQTQVLMPVWQVFLRCHQAGISGPLWWIYCTGWFEWECSPTPAIWITTLKSKIRIQNKTQPCMIPRSEVDP